MNAATRWRWWLPLLLAVLSAATLYAQVQYQRPVDAAPQVKNIGGGYQLPAVQRPQPRPQWREIADVGLLAGALGVSTWLVLRRRSRKALIILTIGCLLYFGLYRQGCVCPIGAIQNVALALTDSQYAISYVVIAIFFLPLVLAALFGRVFCSGVCPLGAIQELVLLKPLHVPARLDKALGWLKWIYLALALWLATRPMSPPGKTSWLLQRDFIICRFDPFVGFFRFAGPLYMLLIGFGLLVLGLFIGRPYCRYLCPYGALLSLLSRISWRGVTITPDKELDCGLCAESCPYGAIENMRAVRHACLACARCYNTCPRHRVLTKADPPHAGVTPPTVAPGSNQVDAS